MPKLERLIELARLKHRGKRMTVRELSLACGVSQRTLYRYLNNLSELTALIDLAGGDRSQISKSNPADLTSDELALVRYVFAHNPVTVYPHLVRRLRSIQKRLGLGRTRNTRGDIYDFKTGSVDQVSSKSDALLRRFEKACAQGDTATVYLKTRSDQGKVVYPRGVLVENGTLKLLVSKTAYCRPGRIKLDSVLKIVLNRSSTKSK